MNVQLVNIPNIPVLPCLFKWPALKLGQCLRKQHAIAAVMDKWGKYYTDTLISFEKGKYMAYERLWGEKGRQSLGKLMKLEAFWPLERSERHFCSLHESDCLLIRLCCWLLFCPVSSELWCSLLYYFSPHPPNSIGNKWLFYGIM